MKKRQIKKENKKNIANLLNQIISITRLTVINKKSCFTMEYGHDNYILNFNFKEIPEWKFAIWSSQENGYSFFGQPTVLIDKFKPQRSDFDYIKRTVYKGLEILIKLANGEDYYKVNDSISEYKEYQQKKHLVNFGRLNSIKEYIKYTSDNYDNYDVRLEDRNTKSLSISPRYLVTLWADEPNTLSLEDSKNIYKEICERFPAEEDSSFLLDTYIFSDLSEVIMSPETYNKCAIKYKWDEKDFDEMVKAIA